MGGSPADEASRANTDMLQSMVSDFEENHQRFYEAYEGGLLSSDKQHIYFMGVIDIFTGYTLGKKFENLGKSIV